jgi:2-(1,2-epoxy-1,2-dihydrophenyl)acetyl-CoA isomerase
MTETPLLFSVDGDGIARIILNRPQCGNTIDQAMVDHLLEAAVACATDTSIRCVLLTGAGRMFCAGGDIGAFKQAGSNIGAFLKRLAGGLHQAMTHLGSMRKPLVILVNGPAAGAGLSIALAGDLVLASASAHFTAGYSAIGLTPDGGMTWLLPRLVGLRRAQDILLTGRRVSANEAADIGMVTRVVSDEDLSTEGEALACRLAQGPADALGGTRRLLLASMNTGLTEQMNQESREIAAAGVCPEGREGIAAFLAKRKPDFKAAK